MARQDDSKSIWKILFPLGIAPIVIYLLSLVLTPKGKDALKELRNERQQTLIELQELEKDGDYKTKSPRDYGRKELELQEKVYQLDELIKKWN